MNNHKPLGQKAYGSIAHLPGSRRGPADRGLSDGQAAILTTKARDRHDTIIVQEKLDGSNVAAARIDDQIVALSRSGYLAASSPYYQHHVWAWWVAQNADRFMSVLSNGERMSGEWLMQAHGTRYDLPHEPFVAFDVLSGTRRITYDDLRGRAERGGFVLPSLLHVGGPLSVAGALALLRPEHHGAIDPIEGAVWRVERKGVVDFLGKYVIPGKVDGCYLESVTGQPSVYNWTPESMPATTTRGQRERINR